MERYSRKGKFSLDDVYLVRFRDRIELVPKTAGSEPEGDVIDLAEYSGQNPYALLILLVLFENRYAWEDGRFALCDFFGALQEIEEFRKAITDLHFNWMHYAKLDQPRSVEELVEGEVEDHKVWLADGGLERMREDFADWSGEVADA